LRHTSICIGLEILGDQVDSIGTTFAGTFRELFGDNPPPYTQLCKVCVI